MDMSLSNELDAYDRRVLSRIVYRRHRESDRLGSVGMAPRVRSKSDPR